MTLRPLATFVLAFAVLGGAMRTTTGLGSAGAPHPYTVAQVTRAFDSPAITLIRSNTPPRPHLPYFIGGIQCAGTNSRSYCYDLILTVDASPTEAKITMNALKRGADPRGGPSGWRFENVVVSLLDRRRGIAPYALPPQVAAAARKLNGSRAQAS